MAHEALPGPGEDPTTFWIRLLREAMNGGAEAMPFPIGEEVPAPTLDPERQAAIALDTDFTDDEIIQVEHHPGGDVSLTTRYEDEHGPETTVLTFKLLGPSPRVGDTVRLYRAEVGRLPRGVMFLGDGSKEGTPDRVQFYETDQEYVDRLEQEARNRKARIEADFHQEQLRFDDLPSTLQAHVEMMSSLGRGDDMPALVLQAEQALALARNMPSPNALNGLRHLDVGSKLSVLSNFMIVEGWSEDQADAVFDLALFYLETRDT